MNVAPAVPLGPEWDARWDSLAGGSFESGFMQSTGWAAFKRAEGYETLRYGLLDDDGGLWGGGVLLAWPAEGAEGYVVCPEGPVLPWDDIERARAGLRGLLAVVRQRSAAHGGLGLRIEPHLPPPAPSLLRGWVRAPADLTPEHTLLVDVTRPDDDLLAAMHPKFRYNLRLAQRHGVEVESSADVDDVQRFHDVFIDTAHRQSFFGEPYGFFLNLGAALFPRDMARLYFARRGERDLAALLVIYYGRRATYLYGGSLAEDRAVMPNHLLHWTVMREARARGCREYDLYGYDPFGRPSHLFAGISRFKGQFGAQRWSRLGAYDCLFYDRVADRMVERLAARRAGSA